MRPEEERGHGNFYREIGTKTVCPRFQGAEWKKMAPFSISSGQPCSCQAFMPCLTGDLSVGRGGGQGGGDCHLSEYEKSWQNGSDFINEYMP